MPDACRDARRRDHHHGRRAREQRRVEPVATRVHRTRCVSVRLLHAGQLCSATALLEEFRNGTASVVTADIRRRPIKLSDDEIRERMSGICLPLRRVREHRVPRSAPRMTAAARPRAPPTSTTITTTTTITREASTSMDAISTNAPPMSPAQCERRSNQARYSSAAARICSI